MRISKTQYSTAVVVSVAILVLDAALVESPFLGVPALAALVSLLALKATQLTQDDPRSPMGVRELLIGIVTLASAWTATGAVVYYLYRFDTLAIWLLLLAFSTAAILIPGHAFEFKRPNLEGRLRWTALGVAVVMITALYAASFLIVSSGTTEAIRSPWSVVSPRFLPFLGLTAFASVALSLRHESRTYAAIGAGAALAISLSVAAFAYPLGYGFDPFVHEAAMREVSQGGVVLPKTPYYVGAYTQIVSVSKFASLPLHGLNRFAGPIAGAATLLAVAATVAMLSGSTLLPVAFLLAAFGPIGHFIMTTPQGIADAMALLAATLALASATRGRHFVPAYIAAAAALFTHPIAGIPALGLVAAVHLGSAYRLSAWRSAAAVAALVAIASFPTFAFISQRTIGVAFDPLGGTARVLALALEAWSLPEAASLSSGRTLVYALRALFPFLLITSAWYGAFKTGGDRRSKAHLVAAAGATALGGFAFAFLLRLEGTIAAESLIFPMRFVSLAGIFLFPLALMAWLEFAGRLAKSIRGRAALAAGLALLVPTTVYLAYPRVDPEDLSKGYNVTAPTVAAVDAIAEAGKGEYVVLGNQTDAAAEIWRRGFTRYYNGEFFVAHQSGAPGLYAHYLRAVEDGVSRERMREVMAEYGVDTVFLIVHDYWRGAERAVAEARSNADSAYEIDGGKIWVFEYKK